MVTPRAQPYWDAAAQGRLVIQHCVACGADTHFPSDVCGGCGAPDPGWREVGGRGVVHTFSVVHRTTVPGFAVPFVIAWIDLDDGPRVFGNVVGCPPGDVHIGQPVRVVFEEREGFGPVPTFTAAQEPS